MKLLPVVERELRAMARRPSAYWIRSGSALMALGALGYVALIGAVGFSTSDQGRELFGILSWGAFAYCLLAGMRGTSDALSYEKREGTLGLLFLTNLKGYDVVFGKLVSVSINSIYGILAVAPPLALAFLLGGTSGAQFVTMVMFLLNTLFFSLSVGMLVSTFCQNERTAMGGTLAILFSVLTMPFGLAAAHAYAPLEIWEVMQPGFLLCSPGFAFWAIKDPTLMKIYSEEVRLSIAFANLAGWLCLVIASGSIASRAHADATQGKVAMWFTRIRQQWAYGKASRRRAIRGALLDRNAFAWLAGRDRLKQRYAWIFLILFGGLWLLGRWKAPEITEEWPITLFALWFVQFFFKVWIASEVAARFIEDRRSNALELLLTTPLHLKDFVRGQRLAILRQFGAPLIAVVFLNFFLGMRAVDSSDYLIRSPKPMQFFAAGLAHLIFDLYAIHWVAIWRSLHLRGTNRTISQTLGMVIFLPVAGWFFIWQGSWIAWAVVGGNGPSAVNILWTWTVLCVFYDVLLALIARHSFYETFRELATRPFEKPSPFKWKSRRERRALPVAEPSPAAVIKLPNPTRRYSFARKVAFVGVIFLFCGYVAVVIRRRRLDAAVTSRMEVSRALAPLTTLEFAMGHPAPAANESASVLLRRASKLIPTTAVPVQLVDNQAHWNTTEKLSPELRNRVTTWLSENRSVFDTLEQLPTNKPGGPPSDLRSWEGIKTDEITHALQMKARAELEDDPVVAAKTISLLLYYIRALEGERFYAFMGANNALKAASHLLERAAVQGGFSAEVWREWRRILCDSNPIATLRLNLIYQRAEGLEAFSQPVTFLYQRFGISMGDFPALFKVAWSIRRFFGQDRVEIIEFLDELNDDIAKSDRPFWEVHNGASKPWRGPTIASSTIIAPQLEPAFDWIISSTTYMVARHRILMTVCDLEMYRAEHGSLPTYPAEIPAADRVDPFTGNDLRYIVRGNDYTLYSVGEDRTDDGGVGPKGHRGGDIAFNRGMPPEIKRALKNP